MPPSFRLRPGQARETTVKRSRRTLNGPGMSLGLAASVPLRRDGDGVVAVFTLEGGRGRPSSCAAGRQDAGRCLGADEAEELFRETVAYWQRWLPVHLQRPLARDRPRSALALKLLTFEPTGAIVAAPTCSLPEGIGGARNWDYRYTWIRDAAFTIYALLRIGFTEEASRFMEWLEVRCQDRPANATAHSSSSTPWTAGGSSLVESTLDHLDGYRGSMGVRIGNSAPTTSSSSTSTVS